MTSFDKFNESYTLYNIIVMRDMGKSPLLHMWAKDVQINLFIRTA